MAKQTNNDTSKANGTSKASDKPVKADSKATPKTIAKAKADAKGNANDKRTGLSAKQRQVLAYLASAKGWVGKAKVWYDCSAGTSVLGAATRDGFGVQANGGLLALGYVECADANAVGADGKGRVAYRLSATGKKALADATKAAK